MPEIEVKKYVVRLSAEEHETLNALIHNGKLRWPRLAGQFGGFVKLGPGSCQAASLVAPSPPTPMAEYTSSGVCPARLEWGRRPL